ncbi:MAG: ATP-binding cassette domain-containing protein [Moraxella sp.]|nr:ATP-binding cassette domain-containing protein [Moraxella sp.]
MNHDTNKEQSDKILIKIKNLSVHTKDGTILVEPVSLAIKAGQNLTILGETGSGKSLLAQAVMGALPDGLMVKGQIIIDGKVYHDGEGRLDAAKFRSLWGRQLAMLPQEPVRSLDPTMTALGQVAESLEFVKQLTKATAKAQATQALDTLALSHATHHYPHELSGGMAQRVSFASATVSGANMVIADEPTKGLDHKNKLIVADMLAQVAKAGGCLLTITHDIEVASRLSGDNDLMMVMKKGKLLEQGYATDVLNHPKSDYAKELMSANPATWVKGDTPTSDKPLLTLDNVAISRGKKELFSGLNLTLCEGQAVGLIGDSGIGKSSLGDMICGLINPSKGSMTWHTKPARHQVLKLYQDPPSAFAAGVTLGTLIDDVVRRHRLDKNEIAPLMDALGLHPDLLHRTSDGVSGGELQRIAIMRALMMKPVLLFADEVTNRLDPITQKTTLDLLTKACHAQNCTLIMASHDHELTRHYCDVVVDLGEYAGPTGQS